LDKLLLEPERALRFLRYPPELPERASLIPIIGKCKSRSFYPFPKDLDKDATCYQFEEGE
jgi:hypothetical protein